jgi:hypothetical protein
MKFPIPDGFEMPPDADVGGEFQAVGTFQDNGDGTLTLIQIDGADIEGYEMEKEEPEAEVEIKVEAEGEEATGLFDKARKAGIPMKM